ncbi:hypothetical protein V8E54_006235 [Elaphomyces granulatus]
MYASFEPDDEDDSTLDPRQTSGNPHASEHSPEITREPSGDRSRFDIDEEFNTVSKMLLKLVQQRNCDSENLRRQGEYIMRLQELQQLKSKRKEPQISNPKAPAQADIASPPPPVEDSKDFDINSNEHSADRSAQGQASAPPSNNISTTSIEGEDPNDLGDKKIPNTRQGRVSRAANPSSTPIAAHSTASLRRA